MQAACSRAEVEGEIGYLEDSLRAKVGWDIRPVEGFVVVEALVPYRATFQGGLAPFGSCCVLVAFVGQALRRGRRYVVAEGKVEGFEECFEGGSAGSLRQLNYLALRHIPGRTYCPLE